MRDTFFVTTKAAIYSDDGKSILVMQLFPNDGAKVFGLPGGHLDENETPDEAIARELDEELGITIDALERRDFFLHENGKVVLAYTATVSADLSMTPSNPHEEIGVWKTYQEFEELRIDAGYKQFVIKNWIKR